MEEAARAWLGAPTSGSGPDRIGLLFSLLSEFLLCFPPPPKKKKKKLVLKIIWQCLFSPSILFVFFFVTCKTRKNKNDKPTRRRDSKKKAKAKAYKRPQAASSKHNKKHFSGGLWTGRGSCAASKPFRRRRRRLLLGQQQQQHLRSKEPPREGWPLPLPLQERRRQR